MYFTSKSKLILHFQSFKMFSMFTFIFFEKFGVGPKTHTHTHAHNDSNKMCFSPQLFSLRLKFELYFRKMFYFVLNQILKLLNR